MPYVTSSAVDWVDRHPETGTMEIRYKEGDRYSYFGVPEQVYRGLLEAPSIGAYVNERIKPFYRFELEQRRRRFRPPAQE
ncbi:MAG TPA: KTSC domain-containing protein [Allosphingosinicella sp.]|nr:KTSC domain-containing protein [Allosphingosinicella sp.]